MTSMQRLKARMNGEAVDKIPNTNIAMALVAKCAGVSYREYAQDYRKLVEGNLYCAEHYGFDCVSAISDPMREAGAFGAEVIMPEEGVPYSEVHLLEGDEPSADLLRIVSPYDNERTLDRIKAVELFRERVGGDIPIIGWVEGVLAEFADLRGVSELMMDLAAEEDFLPEIMEVIHRGQCAFIKAQIDAGADIIGVGNAVASLIGPDYYERYALEYDKKAVQFIRDNGALAKLHICGNIAPILPQLRLVEPDILDVDWMVDIKTACDAMKDTKTCVSGNMDPVEIFMRGTVAEVEAATRRCIEQTDNRSLIAGGCEIPASTPVENLIAMNKVLFF